jgi:Kef-type K+ transport system membrane component KefB
MELPVVFLGLGGVLVAGMLTDEIGRRTRLPRVTLMILFGVAVGPIGFGLLPLALYQSHEFLTSAALAMVAFLLGGRLTLTTLRQHGATILTVSAAVVLLTVLTLVTGLVAVGAPLVLALLLAGIATATAPVATHDVVKQVAAKGPFTTTLLGIVAIDDAWGIIAFSSLLLIAQALDGGAAVEILQTGLWEVLGALLVGAVVGLPAAYLTGRLHPGEPIQTEALGVVFLCAGLAIWLDVSFLLAGMTAGAVVANLARHHNRPFHEIEHIETPFMVLFFVLAGASLAPGSLAQVGVIAAAYVVLRTLSRAAGGWIGASLAHEPASHRRWIGLALTPQAGVALGMALIAADRFPEHAEVLLAVTVGSTIIFELFGPLLTQTALRRVGEAREGQ